MAVNWTERKAYLATSEYHVDADRWARVFRKDGKRLPGMADTLPAKASALVFSREQGLKLRGAPVPQKYRDRDGKVQTYGDTYHPFPNGGFGIFAVPNHRYMIVQGPPDEGTLGGRPGWLYYSTWTQGEEVEPGLFEMRPPEVPCE